MRSASDLLDENVEAAALWGRVVAQASSSTRCAVQLEAKLTAGVAAPDVDLGVKDFCVIRSRLLSVVVLLRETLARGALTR